MALDHIDDDPETDRWHQCDAGHTHWGTQGAAGLLIRHTDEQMM